MKIQEQPQWERDVREWHERSLALIECVSNVHDALDLHPESPLHTHPWSAIGGWAKVLERTHNLSDWLDYWMHEVQFGATPVGEHVTLPDGKAYPLATIDDLIVMLAADKALAEGGQP